MIKNTRWAITALPPLLPVAAGAAKTKHKGESCQPPLPPAMRQKNTRTALAPLPPTAGGWGGRNAASSCYYYEPTRTKQKKMNKRKRMKKKKLTSLNEECCKAHKEKMK
jgi:hypothetical protein